jgi:hypothetical protein
MWSSAVARSARKDENLKNKNPSQGQKVRTMFQRYAVPESAVSGPGLINPSADQD